MTNEEALKGLKETECAMCYHVGKDMDTCDGNNRDYIKKLEIESSIIEAARRRNLTCAQNFNGRAYALMDADLIRYFDTLDEVLEFLGISVDSLEKAKGYLYDALDGEEADEIIKVSSQGSCKDTISREQVKSDYADWFGYGYKDNWFYKHLSNIPPVTPQSKTGHYVRWYEKVECKDWTEYIPHCKCSECGEEYDSHSSRFIKFCPNCGAKMQEVGE